MYRPPAFVEDRPEVLHAAISAWPLGTLITCGEAGLEANLLPFLPAEDGSVIRAHLARANPQLAALAEGKPVLVLFQGPQAYVSPSWHPAKAEHGRVVPTWNYIVVEIAGTPALHDRPDWLLAQVDALTRVHEAGQHLPWAVSDAPARYIEAQLNGIVGLEISVSRLTGKWKVSQNQPAAARQALAEGLRQTGEVGMADAIPQA